MRIVDWKKIHEFFGNLNGFWAYDMREFCQTQEERVQFAIAAERNPQSDDVDPDAADWE